MKSPRFLAALAMAAVLTTGATTAHASFQQVTGTGANGQTPMQQAESTSNLSSTPTDVQGDIGIDGTFTKRINNFPTPTTEGRYLRVTMPIKVDFTYDVDTHTMTSAEAVITNNSVLATPSTTNSGKLDITNQKIEMTIVDYVKNDKGTTTMGAPVKFVQDVNATGNPKDEILLPFELQISSPTGRIKEYSLETIEGSSGTLPAIEIAENSTVKLKLDKINGQNLGNADLINQHTSLTSHNLKLKFEYAGN